MSKVRTFTNRLLVFLIFLLTGVRVAVARVWPFNPPPANPPAPKVFALTEAEWVALRAMDGATGGSTQDPQTTESKTPSAKSTSEKKSQSADEKKAAPPTQQKPQSAEEKKATTPAKDKKAASDDKKGEKKNPAPHKPGVGGGDGDMDGGGG